MTDGPYLDTGEFYLVSSFPGVGVGRVLLDYQVTLHIGSDALVIEQPFEVSDGSTVVHVVPGVSDQLGGAVTLLHAVCRSVQLHKNGTLRVEFAHDRVLVVPPSAEFESWHASVRGRHMVVCGPGGVLSFFG